MEKAYFAGGCFWCIEAVMQRLIGVTKVVSGYAGGKMKDPSYEKVSSGSTGHAETVEVTFDPKKIKFKTLLDVFFTAHNPTTLNRQGNDVGDQYRSAIFYVNDKQKEEAEKYIKKLEAENVFDKPIVTDVVRLNKFFPAEDYHQNYYEKNANASYCQVVINPKLQKIREKFSKYLKTG